MLCERLLGHVAANPGATALQVKREAAYVTWTYSSLLTQALSVAASLNRAGAGAGQRVALFAENSPEWVVAYLGVHLAGATVVPLDSQYSQRELRNVLSVAGCRVLLFCKATEAAALAAVAASGIGETFCIDPGSPLFSGRPLDKPVTRPAGSLMAVIFTSGTTGEPKGVCLTDSNIESNIDGILGTGIVTLKDTSLCILPLHHCYAMTVAVLTPLAAGASITFCSSLKGPDIMDAIRETGVTIALVVPQLVEAFDRAVRDSIRQLTGTARFAFKLLQRLARLNMRLTGRSGGTFLFPSARRRFGSKFRFFVSGGARLDPGVAERLLCTGIPVIEGYGLTETSPVVTFNPVDKPRPGSVGKPLMNVAVRIDQPGADGVGEVLVKGPNVMWGYDKRSEDTAAMIKDGWLHTGDLGFLDAGGYLRLTGRIKEVIVMASGKNIYPEDVERCYVDSPLIQELCVIAITDGDGQVRRLRAVIAPELSELERRKSISINDAIRIEVAQIGQQLPSYMRLNDLKLVSNQLPRTRLGKLRRAEIAGMAFDEVEARALPVAEEDLRLLDVPGAKRLLEQLAAMTTMKRPIVPADHLELDLGLDSLARVELEVVLEREFGVRIAPDEGSSIATVRDLLVRLTDNSGVGADTAKWRELLRQRIQPPLAEIFGLAGRWHEKLIVRVARKTGRLLAALTLRFDVKGLHNLPGKGPYILCPTHASYLDAVLIFLGLPGSHVRDMFFLGAEEIFTSPMMKWIARVGQVIPTGTSDTVLTSLRRAAEALEAGKSVCIFPEGGMARDGVLQRPRPGAGILACELGVPIVPVLMRGTYDNFSPAHPGLRFRSVGLTVGEPLASVADKVCGNEDYVASVTAWYNAIVQLRRADDAAGGPTSGRSPLIPQELNRKP